MMMKMKTRKYRIKKLSADKLRESEGKVHTEEMFIRDSRLVMMFLKYMVDNIGYLARYETDNGEYDQIRKELVRILKDVETLDESFKKHQV